MNLCRLELKKIRLSTYLWAILGIFVCLLTLGILFLFIFQLEGGNSTSDEAKLFTNWDGLLALITALAFSCFSIFSAVLAAKVIISEYCGKFALIILSYPVRRKTIFHAKSLVVTGITIVSAFIVNTLVIGIMYISARVFRVMPQMSTEHFHRTVMISSFLMSILSSATGIISTTFGWKKHSITAAIVCALIMVCVLVNCITISPSSIIWVMSTISTVLVVIAAIVYHILANGIEKMEV